MNKELLLIKLPSIKNVNQDFYGVGFHGDEGIAFVLLTEDIINMLPCRFLSYAEYGKEEPHYSVIGKIQDLKRTVG